MMSDQMDDAPDMPAKPARADVIAQDKQRKLARSKLRQDGALAKAELAPSNLFGRWKSRQQRRASEMLASGKAATQKNAPVIGAVAAAAVLFAARKPITHAIRQYRHRTRS